eukprot:3632066-Prymnesium_polylepis.1
MRHIIPTVPTHIVQYESADTTTSPPQPAHNRTSSTTMHTHEPYISHKSTPRSAADPSWRARRVSVEGVG